jgi:two-component system nitrogen regulation sensor histidine kinase GlnL
MVLAAHYKQILDNLLTAAIVLDEDLHLTFVNSSAEMLLSISGDQVLGKHVSHCFGDQETAPETFREA